MITTLEECSAWVKIKIIGLHRIHLVGAGDGTCCDLDCGLSTLSLDAWRLSDPSSIWEGYGGGDSVAALSKTPDWRRETLDSPSMPGRRWRAPQWPCDLDWTRRSCTGSHCAKTVYSWPCSGYH